jgi:chemotaxis family two-component system response regulator Rcp1
LSQLLRILLVEDNPAEIRLTREALAASNLPFVLDVAADGTQALAFLRREGGYLRAKRPDLILLDWNLPGIAGHEVLLEIKEDAVLGSIPVVVLTTSRASADVERAYRLHANCFITKPVDVRDFFSVIQEVERFWMCVASLPGGF